MSACYHSLCAILTGDRGASTPRQPPQKRCERVEVEKLCTVFVVDDDESVRKARRRLLSSSGYQVATFESAEELLHSDLFRTGRCFVLDIRLPGVSGLDLYENLIASEAKRSVIFMTAHENPEWEERAIRTGAIAYLRKPFDEQSLLDAVDLACRKQREENCAHESTERTSINR